MSYASGLSYRRTVLGNNFTDLANVELLYEVDNLILDPVKISKHAWDRF